MYGSDAAVYGGEPDAQGCVAAARAVPLPQRGAYLMAMRVCRARVRMLERCASACVLAMRVHAYLIAMRVCVCDSYVPFRMR